jgi:hypothetical protein
VNLDGMVVGQRKGEIWRSLRRNQFHMGKVEAPNKTRTTIKIAPSHRTQFSRPFPGFLKEEWGAMRYGKLSELVILPELLTDAKGKKNKFDAEK